jgi:hypothetical protein
VGCFVGLKPDAGPDGRLDSYHRPVTDVDPSDQKFQFAVISTPHKVSPNPRFRTRYDISSDVEQ